MIYLFSFGQGNLIHRLDDDEIDFLSTLEVDERLKETEKMRNEREELENFRRYGLITASVVITPLYAVAGLVILNDQVKCDYLHAISAAALVNAQTVAKPIVHETTPAAAPNNNTTPGNNNPPKRANSQ